MGNSRWYRTLGRLSFEGYTNTGMKNKLSLKTPIRDTVHDTFLDPYVCVYPVSDRVSRQYTFRPRPSCSRVRNLRLSRPQDRISGRPPLDPFNDFEGRRRKEVDTTPTIVVGPPRLYLPILLQSRPEGPGEVVDGSRITMTIIRLGGGVSNVRPLHLKWGTSPSFTRTGKKDPRDPRTRFRDWTETLEPFPQRVVRGRV